MQRGYRTIAVWAVSLALWGCDDEIPQPSGDLSQPGALAYVEWDEDLPLADLFIADAEVEGVRLQQFVKSSTTSDAVTAAFALAPVVYFPLIIPTPGTPIALTASRLASLPYLYVLSPNWVGENDTRGGLHLVSLPPVRACVEACIGASRLTCLNDCRREFGPTTDPGSGRPVGPRFDDPYYRQVATVSLASFAEGVPVDAVAVGLAEGERELVVLVYDQGEEAGTLILLSIDPADPTAASVLDEVSLGRQPRKIALVEPTETNDEPRTLLIAHAGETWISEVSVDVMASRFLGASAVDVGGPTGAVLDGQQLGAFALRVDRPSVTHLERDDSAPAATRYRRSSIWFDSPFTPEDERCFPAASTATVGADGCRNRSMSVETARGRLDFRNSVVTGSYGGPTQPPVTWGGQGGMMLVEETGRAYLVGGDPPSLDFSLQSIVTQVDQRLERYVDDAGSVIEAPPIVARECRADRALDCRAATDSVDPDCRPEIIGSQDFSSLGTYRAEYRGALARSRTGRLDPGVGAGQFFLTDPNVTDFDRRLIQTGASSGDSVLLQVNNQCQRTVRIDQAMVNVDTSRFTVDFGNALDCPDGTQADFSLAASATVDGITTSGLTVQPDNMDPDNADPDFDSLIRGEALVTVFGDADTQATFDVELVCRRPVFGTARVLAVDATTLALDWDMPDVLSCPDGFERSGSTVLFEVYPSGEEVVLTEVRGETVREVLERVPVLDTGTQRLARFEHRLQLTLLGSDMQCVESAARVDPSDPGSGRNDYRRLCLAAQSIQDCGPGRTCGAIPPISDTEPRNEICLTKCSVSCAEDATGDGCMRAERVRRCSGLDFTVSASQVLFQTFQPPATTGIRDVTNAIPIRTVYADVRGGWVTSFAGSRTLMTVTVGSQGFASLSLTD